MKKIYSKPQIVFESFSLSQNIAAGCEFRTNTPAQDQCGLDFSGVMVFMDGMTGCEHIQVGENEHWNKICYHIPLGDNLFNS